MTFDPTKPCRLRDGRSVRILATDLPGAFSIAGCVTNGDGQAVLLSWTADGKSDFRHCECPLDLVNIPETFELQRWVNVWKQPTDPKIFTSGIFPAKSMADAARGDNRIACVKVTIRGNVGDGL